MLSKNLKYYRLKKKMTMKELAKACDVSPMAISYYESGKRKPDIEIIKRLAKALDIKVSDFLANRNPSLSFTHLEFRKHSALSKSEKEFVIEATEEYFGRFFDVLECLGGNPLAEPPKAYTLTRGNDIEESAKKLREYLSLPGDGPIGDLITVFENKGILVYELDIDNDRFFGMNGFVSEYPYIVINANMRKERKRTTLLHELAHLMFIWDEKEDNEKEATAIAGATLILKDDLIRELGIHKSSITKDMSLVCEEYGISMYLLVKRAAIAGIISSSLEKDFYIKANKGNWRINEPDRVISEEKTSLFNRLVYRAVNEEGLSISRGAELLKIPVSEMGKYCGRVEV